MKKILFTLILIPFISFSLSLKIPESALNSSVQKSFPISKSVLYNDITLSNPIIKVYDAKLHIELDYTSKILTKPFKGKLYLSSALLFDDTTGDLYFKNIKLEKITTGKKEYSPEENFILKKILSSLYPSIENKSFFNTKKHSITNLLKIKDVNIVKNDLLVIF